MARRLRGLGDQYRLGEAQIAQLRALLALLAADENAPTTVRAPDAAVDIHVADSLAGLGCRELHEASVVADLGAGAGFPSLVLACALPTATVCAVESVGRKAGFISRAAEAVGLRNVEVVRARVEEWAQGTERCDVVVARALAPLGVLCEYSAPLLKQHGVLVAWKGVIPEEEAANASAAAAQLGLMFDRELAVRPFAASERRRLVVYRKSSPTPPGFPRRAGMAVKKPLRTVRAG